MPGFLSTIPMVLPGAVLALALAPLPSTAAAQETVTVDRAEEISLAEEAGPPGLVAGATIYVRGSAGYEVERAGDNGASCLVSQDRPDTLEPICFDSEGTRALLPMYLDRGAWRAAGIDEEEIEARIAAGFASGKYQPPARAGVAYMLSPRNKVFTGTEVISYPPHVMVYAPYVTNADIGADMSDRHMPWVLSEGGPHAYIIVVVGEG